MAREDITELGWLPALPAVTELQLYKLFHLLWDVEFCHSCLTSNTAGECGSHRCGSHTATSKYGSFVLYYKKTCGSYNSLALSGEPALGGHDDLRRTIQILRSHPHLAKSDIRQLIYPSSTDSVDEECALDLAVSIFTMLNCRSQDSSSILLEEGSNRIGWRSGTSLMQYIEMVLPARGMASPPPRRLLAFLDPSSPMAMAKELKRMSGTRFRGTDDITNHLRYDTINNVLFIFHHATFLKEQLKLSKDSGPDPSDATCLRK